MENPNELLSPQEVADILGISRRTVYELFRAQRIETVNVSVSGNIKPRRRVRRAALNRFVKDRTERPKE